MFNQNILLKLKVHDKSKNSLSSVYISGMAYKGVVSKLCTKEMLKILVQLVIMFALSVNS